MTQKTNFLDQIKARINRMSDQQIALSMIGFSIILVVIGLFVWQLTRNLNQQINPNLILDDTKLVVAASIFPLADITENVGGDRVEVIQVMPSGASPHNFEPSPQQMAEISQAEVMFAVGHGLDTWAIEAAEAQGIPVIIVDDNIRFIESDDHAHQDESEADDHDADTDDHHSETGEDPHYWLSIPNGMLISNNISQALSEQFPKYASEFEANHNRYAAVLAKADAQLRTRITDIPNRALATFHNAWLYLARDYGFQVVATFEEFPGQEPTPGYLQQFQDQVEANNLRVIYYEPEFSTQPLEPIAQDLGVTLVLLDPLGGLDDRQSYLELMEFNLSQIINTRE